MEYQAINWEEVYESLQLETIKTTGKWMLVITLAAGLAIIALLILLFRKHPVAIAFMALGVFMFSGKYAIGLWRMSKHPKVYSGVVIAKNENSHTEESTAVSYITHQIRLNAATGSDLTENGLGEIKNFSRKKLKINCPEEIFNALTEGDSLMVVVLPHDKSIVWFYKNQKKKFN